MNVILQRGDKNADVLHFVQEPLRALGYAIDCDGIFGPQTETIFKHWQGTVGLAADGKFGPLSAAKLCGDAHPAISPPDSELDISVKAFQLIIDYEVGGGEAYYNRFLKHPTWPGGASGVTIGVGFDLGYEGTMQPWRGKLSDHDFERLSDALGVKGVRARVLAGVLDDIVISWDDAVDVFENYTIEREVRKTHAAFPGLWKLPLDVQGALVSLVFNRGTSMTGDSRREMREIKESVWVGDCEAIADAIVRMKRLWGKDMSGLWRRRDAEARLIREAIA